MTTREKIYEVLEKYFDDETDSIERTDENGEDFGIEEEVEELLTKLHLPFKTSMDDMFDNSGCDISSISIAWWENEEINLIVERIFVC